MKEVVITIILGILTVGSALLTTPNIKIDPVLCVMTIPMTKIIT